MRPFLALIALSAAAGLALQAQQPAAPKPPPPKAYDKPEESDADFPIQGEYAGELNNKKYGVQIWAQGGGKFEAVTYPGGLPGDGWNGDREKVRRAQGQREGAKAVFHVPDKNLTAEVDGATITVSDGQGAKICEFSRTVRTSPTEGARPPEGAVVLFGGKDANRFLKSRVTEDGLLMEGATSEDTFTDFSAHVEFRLAYTPEGRGQGRSNSGVYLQGRYEVQVLDSFALEGKDNECGGLYKVAGPQVNMCYPPLTWQTYDIDFTAAKYDAEGKKTANARVTVKHNGVLIQDNRELSGVTGGAIAKEENKPGPIFLQNHNNPVRFRNIWVKAK